MISKTMMVITILLIVSNICSCATPVSYSSSPLITYDKDTEYSIEERTDGFVINVYYSRYQFIPESSAIAVACKSALTSIAHEYGDKQGRKIEQVNEQRIKLSMGRNDLSGTTDCSASVIVSWLK